MIGLYPFKKVRDDTILTIRGATVVQASSTKISIVIPGNGWMKGFWLSAEGNVEVQTPSGTSRTQNTNFYCPAKELIPFEVGVKGGETIDLIVAISAPSGNISGAVLFELPYRR